MLNSSFPQLEKIHTKVFPQPVSAAMELGTQVALVLEKTCILQTLKFQPKGREL